MLRHLRQRAPPPPWGPTCFHRWALSLHQSYLASLQRMRLRVLSSDDAPGSSHFLSREVFPDT